MAGLYAMEEGGFRLALMNAVIAATQRSKELGEALQKPSSSYPFHQQKRALQYSSVTPGVKRRKGRIKKNPRNIKVTRKLR
jgi:hypothetical protein